MAVRNSSPAAMPVVVHANWFQFAPRQRVRHRGVRSRMVLWCKSGRGHVRANEQRISMAPGSFVVLPWQHRIQYEPNEVAPFLVAGVHVIPHHDVNRPVAFHVAHNDEDALAHARWRRDAALAGLEHVVMGNFASRPALSHLAEYVVARFTAMPSPDEAEMRRLGTIVLDELSRLASGEPTNRDQVPAALSRMLDWLRDHVDQPSDLSALANVGGCSTSTVRRLFQQHLHTAPQEWIARAKLARAEALVRSTSLPIADVARQVGFDDPFYFSRWFRRHRGLSPRESRRRQARL